MFSFMPGSLYPQGDGSLYPLYRRLSGAGNSLIIINYISWLAISNSGYEVMSYNHVYWPSVLRYFI